MCVSKSYIFILFMFLFLFIKDTTPHKDFTDERSTFDASARSEDEDKITVALEIAETTTENVDPTSYSQRSSG